MKLRIKRQVLIFGTILALLLFLLWPLGSRKWAVLADEDAQRVKETILDGQSRVRRNAPRIVIILADDLSIVDTSIYGGTVVQTPNIDSIGHEGVVFTDASCTTAVCAPLYSCYADWPLPTAVRL